VVEAPQAGALDREGVCVEGRTELGEGYQEAHHTPNVEPQRLGLILYGYIEAFINAVTTGRDFRGLAQLLAIPRAQSSNTQAKKRH